MPSTLGGLSFLQGSGRRAAIYLEDWSPTEHPAGSRRMHCACSLAVPDTGHLCFLSLPLLKQKEANQRVSTSPQSYSSIIFFEDAKVSLFAYHIIFINVNSDFLKLYFSITAYIQYYFLLVSGPPFSSLSSASCPASTASLFP